LSRRKSRVLALQMLFQQDLSDTDWAETVELFWKVRKASPEDRQYADFLFSRAQENRQKIEKLIRENAHRWRLERMSSVDRNLLIMAIAELLTGETPTAVVIDEAVEIAKEYGGEKSAEFVNGILDTIAFEQNSEAGSKN